MAPSDQCRTKPQPTPFFPWLPWTQSAEAERAAFVSLLQLPSLLMNGYVSVLDDSQAAEFLAHLLHI